MSTPEPQELRSRVYGLLGHLLAGPPSADLLQRLAAVETDTADDEPLPRAWRGLAAAARSADPEALDDEYHALFIGLGRGELVPYASWYITGLLMEQPLADLRRDLQRLGIERRTAVSEPEDHAAALCQAMALLCVDTTEIEPQQAFVSQHLAPWLGRFFSDLQQAETADFYRAVAALGLAFLEFEQQFLEIDSIPTRSHKREGHSHEQA